MLVELRAHMLNYPLVFHNCPLLVRRQAGADRGRCFNVFVFTLSNCPHVVSSSFLLKSVGQCRTVAPASISHTDRDSHTVIQHQLSNKARTNLNSTSVSDCSEETIINFLC